MARRKCCAIWALPKVRRSLLAFLEFPYRLFLASLRRQRLRRESRVHAVVAELVDALL